MQHLRPGTRPPEHPVNARRQWYALKPVQRPHRTFDRRVNGTYVQPGHLGAGLLARIGVLDTPANRAVRVDPFFIQAQVSVVVDRIA
jgi:hypothetical protein